MKKVLAYILSTLLALITLILILAAFQPTEWTVERSVLIDAPREKIWSIVSDLNRYSEWNPYAHLDPEARITVEGPAATVGSSYAWDGNQSGAGRMTTVAIQEGKRLDFRLDFQRPMAVTNDASFILGPEESPTKMTWAMHGHHRGFTGLLSRAIHLFVSIDALVGQQFDSGLATLKGLAEGSATAPRNNL
ncbi:MAG TPA: SRPBCC family protein [Oligoflexus sp.]|uniref:SRPBCC family protein n=1 Tax=Oligoflexus sp. TaxID=1971216 RepID=UPI002D802CFA|nr:SRPBCC family protein [Oligoflexus sp.]HET9240682.1 SRPBCC family protein [Oligoflexus sp.]